MEDIDREILRLLLADGRMSYTDLGRATGLSTSAVHQRVRRLEQRGVIKGYTVVVDFEAIGLPLSAFVSVTPLDPAAPDDLPSRLADLPEIEACHSVAGSENYILKVRVPTPGALEGLLARIRGVASVSTRTTIVLSTPYEARSLPTGTPQPLSSPRARSGSSTADQDRLGDDQGKVRDQGKAGDHEDARRRA